MPEFIPTPGQMAYEAAYIEAMACVALPPEHPRRVAAIAGLEAAHDLMNQEALEYERTTRDAFLAEMGAGAQTPVQFAEDEGEF
jgi:hypothetical protein